MVSNYERMAANAARLFLRHDQEEMIQRWGLDADESTIYIPFFADENTLGIDRKTGEVYIICEDSDDPGTTDGNLTWEAMTVYDLLTFSRERPEAAGEWVSIAQLGGVIGIRHQEGLSSPLAERFASRPGALVSACERAGGMPEKNLKGDVTFSFRVFKDFRICLQFWDEDDEFPAQIRYFFDRNALRFMHYETLWYVLNILEKRIVEATYLQEGSR